MSSSRTIILGITGGIACGKTAAGCMLAEEGFVVLDTDLLAHEVTGRGRPVYEAVVERFGSAFLDPAGEIDRKKLGRLIFEDASAREALNALVHPAVFEITMRWRSRMREKGRDGAALIPLLFEAGWTEGWDGVICLTAPDEQIFQRLEKRGLSREESRRRMAAQMAPAEKAARADVVIENSGTLDALKVRLTDVVEQIRRKPRKNDE